MEFQILFIIMSNEIIKTKLKTYNIPNANCGTCIIYIKFKYIYVYTYLDDRFYIFVSIYNSKIFNNNNLIMINNFLIVKE